MSQSPAMSDESDFYGSDEEVEVQVQTRSQNENAALDNDVESPGSDAMPMDESPPESPPASLPAMIAPTTIPPASPERSAVKRKLSPVEHEPEVVQKRQKVTTIPEQYYANTVPRTAGLPAEIWQHVFLYLTPDSLSCCLRVNKAFHSYLSSTAATMSIRLPPRKGGMQRTGLKLIDSEAIWTSARKLFAPNLPRPLSGFSEMQMFQLLGGKYCQRCGDPPTGPVNARTPFDAGPGVHGVRIIWSFSARLCGRCFDASAAKDTEILQSPAAPLRAGLAHAFRTNDLHYIPATTLQTNPGGAPRGQMFKVYYHKHILDLQREYEDAKEFGEAAAEEWVKGLPLNGKQQMADAARWERWEALQPPGTHPAKTLREYFRPISAPIPALASPAPVSEVTLAAVPAVSASVPPSNGSSLPVLSSQPMKHPLPARVVAVTQPPSVAPSTVQSSPQSGVPAQNGTNLQNSLPSPHYIPPHHTLPPPPQQSLSQHQQAPTYRPPRNPKEVEEARAARKADIERRCYEEFFPPLLPNVLQHMESFRAAMAMVMPLTDQAWEVLKPRLYMQRDAAEQIEYQRAEQLRALQATIPDPSYRETYSKTANDAAERQWEQQQGPVRKKLGKLADEFIRLKWNNGKGLSRDTAPAFAVEVLLYARNKFVEKNTPKDQVVKEGPRDPRDPAFVSLENMRWLFDNKVKNITERHCRELFMCAECEGVTKGYAFEGMIQHFGAKHTDSFSQGNIVVHWQTADWPDDPPFVPTIGDADPTLPAKHPAPLVASSADAGSYGSSQAYVPPVPGALSNLAPGQLEQLYAALNPQSSQMAAPPTPAYPPRSYGQGASYQPVTAAAPPSVPQFGGAVNIYQDQLNEIAKVARETWDALSRVKDMEESIRVETVLHHVIARFKARYASEPSLDLITDALANHILMRPIKSAHPLACKTCVSASLGMTAYKPYHHRLADHKLYNISSLITHFKTVHLVGQDACAVDWKEDMIEMADEAQIKQLVSAVGMDDERLAIIAPAFPGIFSYPLPRIGRIEELTQDSDDSPRNYNKFNKKDRTRNKNKRLPRNARAVLDHDEDEQSDLPEAGEDEYDPRRPAFIEGPAGRTRSSVSGARRSLGGQTGNGQTPASILTPETIAALSKLAPTLNLNPTAVLGRRSPSFPTVAPAAQANEAAFRANQRAVYHPDDPAAKHTAHTHQQPLPDPEKRQPKKDRNDRRNRRSAAGVSGGEEHKQPEEDYTQIIRTAPANGNDYAAASLAHHPGVVPAVSPGHYATERARSVHPEPAAYVDQYGRPVPVSEPYRYEERERVQYVDEYGRPIEYAPPPREEVRYVDQYGRPVEVVRVVERPVYDRPVYDYPPQQHSYGAPPPGHEYGAPPPGHEYGAPPPGPEYGAPPPGYDYGPTRVGHEYARPPLEHEYGRPAEYGRERMHYVDDYGRPVPYGPPPTY